jgi:hypothetical protein
VAYVGNHGTERSIYVRSLGALESVPVAGTEQGSGPFFSPDGEWLGFVADGKLMKVPVSGGQPQTLCSVTVLAGTSWGPDETIVYTRYLRIYGRALRDFCERRRHTPSPDQARGNAIPPLPGGPSRRQRSALHGVG